jgi:DNA-binding SARP family transcriptional activator
VDYAVLGPLEVRRGDTTVPIGRGKQRALLAILLLNAGRVVSAERLIDELWGNAPPATAATALQVYVSKLRKALGDDVIVTREPGYAIEIERGGFDLQRFEGLLADARRAEGEEAARLFREALEIWRGPALCDVPLAPEAARLDDLRLSALGERIDADLALGRHTDVIPELESLVRQHPLRERPRRQLMLALYRAGRQADALQAYRAARSTLVEELGIEPSPELQALEQAILRQDPSLGLERAKGTVTALFLDLGIRGEVESLAERAFAAAESALAGAPMERGIADALVATFPDAVTALRAALATHDRLRAELGESVAPRSGLATADVAAAAVLAARRVREAKPGEIVAGARTAAAAGDEFTFRRRGDGFVVV